MVLPKASTAETVGLNAFPAMIGAGALMAVTAFAFAGTPAFGHYAVPTIASSSADIVIGKNRASTAACAACLAGATACV